MLFSTVLPSLSGFAGVVVMIAGFAINYRRMSKGKHPTVKPEWEPSLQWGGASSSKKQVGKKPQMAINTKTSSTASKPKKTIVKKVGSKIGSEIACKFCGKMVSQSAFFCPHCYGKVR